MTTPKPQVAAPLAAPRFGSQSHLASGTAISLSTTYVSSLYQLLKR